MIFLYSMKKTRESDVYQLRRSSPRIFQFLLMGFILQWHRSHWFMSCPSWDLWRRDLRLSFEFRFPSSRSQTTGSGTPSFLGVPLPVVELSGNGAPLFMGQDDCLRHLPDTSATFTRKKRRPFSIEKKLDDGKRDPKELRKTETRFPSSESFDDGRDMNQCQGAVSSPRWSKSLEWDEMSIINRIFLWNADQLWRYWWSRTIKRRKFPMDSRSERMAQQLGDRMAGAPLLFWWSN